MEAENSESGGVLGHAVSGMVTTGLAIDTCIVVGTGRTPWDMFAKLDCCGALPPLNSISSSESITWVISTEAQRCSRQGCVRKALIHKTDQQHTETGYER